VEKMRNKGSGETMDNIELTLLSKNHKTFTEEERQKIVPTGFDGSIH
jgi:hypothetical protein